MVPKEKRSFRDMYISIIEYIYDYKNAKNNRKKFINEFKEKKKKNLKTVFLVLTPEHSNLGDHAITYAEISLLKSLDIDYVEITAWDLKKLIQFNLIKFMDGFPILINGGGNLGDLWYGIEKVQRALVTYLPNSKILILPNTISYKNDQLGRQRFNESIDIYNRHPNLTIYAREKISYDIMSKSYNNVKLIPDVVLSLSQISNTEDKKGCILCLRNDLEKTILPEEEKYIINLSKKLFGNNVKELDMHAPKFLKSNERELYLKNQLETFANAKLIITDRLHGMIFSALAQTACIVINSKSPKVVGCYDWIKNLDYIKFANNLSQIEELYSTISNTTPRFDNSHLKHYYEELSNDILNLFD